MKLSELKNLIDIWDARRNKNNPGSDLDVVISLQVPSIGSSACSKVRSASFGFDWDAGKLMLHPETPLAPLTKNQAIFDDGFDFIYQISQYKTPKGNPTTLAKWAIDILKASKDIE